MVQQYLDFYLYNLHWFMHDLPLVYESYVNNVQTIGGLYDHFLTTYHEFESCLYTYDNKDILDPLFFALLHKGGLERYTIWT